MIDEFEVVNSKVKDISRIDLKTTFFHYTNKNNVDSIMKYGLEPRIGKNSLYVEKSKKVFFAIGEIGILTIMDVWLKWLTAKDGAGKLLYCLGTYYMKFPFRIKVLPNYAAKKILDKKSNRKKAYSKLKKILDESVFLILDLEENVDYDYNDIDEVKKTFYDSFLKLLYSNNSSFDDCKMEYWNMHTYSNKVIEPEKISLLIDGEEVCASIIVKNILYVKENSEFLYEYYDYIYNDLSK